MVQPQFRAIRAHGLLIPLLVAGCASSQSNGRPEAETSIINVSRLEIPTLHLAISEGQQVTLRGKVERTEYGSLALFPQGKVVGENDAGKCIDLVYPRSMQDAVTRRSGSMTIIRGRFIYLDTLPDYTMSLDIEGVSHRPVCQIFSNIERYPYFVVDAPG